MQSFPDGRGKLSSIAAVHTALGQNDKAIRLLEEAYEARDAQLNTLKVSELFKPLRDDPRVRHLPAEMQSD